MKILLFSASLRKESLNTKLSGNIERLLIKDKTLEVSVAHIKSLNIPVYDGDIETAGIPKGVSDLGQMINDADVVIISSPEYNGSISAPLKNIIDWVSRLRPTPWTEKPILLTGASPGAFGSTHALTHSKAPFERLGSFVYPRTFGLAKADEAFDANGNLKDERQVQKLEELILKFLNYASKLLS